MGKRYLRTGIGKAGAALLAGCCLAAMPLLGPSSAIAAGETFYASPTASPADKACTQAAPCEIAYAAEQKAEDGDSVRLEAGKYLLPFTGLTIEKEIDLGATAGAPAIVETEELADIQVTGKADAVLHDLRLTGAGNLILESGTAERVFVTHFGVHDDACELGKGTTLLDSVCWTLEVNEEEEGTSDAIGIEPEVAQNQDEPVVLENVTAVAENEKGNAIHALGASGVQLTVHAANVIARSQNGTDIFAEITGGGFPTAHDEIANSDFGEFTEAPPGPPTVSVTPLGTNGNISAPPAFVNAAEGDFHVGATSPTIDAGIGGPLVGEFDLDGMRRVQAGCFGATPTPDMGAFERTATLACPPPPPPPPPPVEPRKPVFRVVSLALNKKTGAGRLLVEVPEGGGTLSLTGSGVKLVRRTAPAEGGVIALPIQTWAITKVRLAKFGKTKVRLKVTFEGRAEPFDQWSKGVLLRKKIK
jgi:hypothetical protein